MMIFLGRLDTVTSIGIRVQLKNNMLAITAGPIRIEGFFYLRPFFFQFFFWSQFI
jgi:hypothetical protein